MSRFALACLICLLLVVAGALPATPVPPARFFRESARFPFPPPASSTPTDDSAAVPDAPALPVLQIPAKEIPVGATSASARGIVVEWRRCPAGMIQGVRLDDGTEVRFPSYPPDPLAELAPPDQPVEVLGWQFPSEAVLHARWIRNPHSTDSVEVDLPPL